MANEKLSSTMQKALDHARQHGGKLERYPGGFWMASGIRAEDLMDGWINRKWFGTPTVQALVNRGELEYTKWQEGKKRRFPIEASVTQEIEHGT